jgi:hypothetical protein
MQSTARLRGWGVLLAAAFVAAACSGSVEGGRPPSSDPGGGATPGKPGGGRPGGSTNPGTSPDPGNGSTTNPIPVPPSVNAGVAPLRRLTSEQYRNTVRDLLGVQETVQASALPGDDSIADRFPSNVVSPVKSIDLDRYADAADQLAAKAVANLAALVPCDPKAGDATCADKFIASFGKRAYRRPLAPAEIERLKKVYTAGGTFTDGVQLVISALLQSPKFLYLPEPVPAGSAGKVVAIDHWAMATRLSYFFLNTMPDDALFAAAEAGQLGTPELIGKQATRLMGDARFRATVSAFHAQWLELAQLQGAEKDAKLFPMAVWNPVLKAALAEESRRFVEYVLTEGDGKAETLLSAPFSFLSGPLYDFYGVPKPAGAALSAWQKADLPKDQRAGILTQGALLATQAHENRTSFILRGKLIREALFCTAIPPPPPEVPDTDSKLSPTATAKERAAAHRDKPECKSCHELFDPVGFAFEIYDAVGRYRATEANGQPVDARLVLTNTRALDGPVANAVELARKLASADEIRECVARQWMRFALGREDAAEDGASLTAATKAFKDGGGKIADLLLAMARSDAFRFQKVAP